MVLSPSTTLCPSTALCPLYGPLSFMSPRAKCLLYGPLPPLGLSVPSTTICLLYCSLYPPWPCSCFNPLSSLQSSVPSTSLCSPLRPSVPLWCSAPSTTLCPLYGSLLIIIIIISIFPSQHDDGTGLSITRTATVAE